MFQLAPILIQLAVGVALQVVGYLLSPKPKAAKPDAAKDMDNPTAEQGRPIPVVFGEVEVTGTNIIWFGQKHTRTREIDA